MSTARAREEMLSADNDRLVLQRRSSRGQWVIPSRRSSGAAPSLSAAFEGPRMFDNGTSFIPPDSCGAAGPIHFVSIVSSMLSIYDKATGARLVDTPLSTLWNYTVSVLGDPRIVFDPHSQRFSALASDCSSSLHIAISLTDDATGAWFKSSIVVFPGRRPWQPS